MSHVSENDATVGVEAAAKAVYEKGREAARQSLSGGTAPSRELPEWDDLHAVTKNEYRNHVLPIVWSFLEALPDPYVAIREANKFEVDTPAGNVRFRNFVMNLVRR